MANGALANFGLHSWYGNMILYTKCEKNDVMRIAIRL